MDMNSCIESTPITFSDLDTRITNTLNNMIFTEILKKYRKRVITFDEFLNLYNESLGVKIERLVTEYYSFVPGVVSIQLGVVELYQKFVK